MLRLFISTSLIAFACLHALAAEDSERIAVKADSVPNLGTRKAGEDWPAFLGPAGDSKSTETGIVTNWPDIGPKRIWTKQVGTGYGMPSISRGRLFQFSRYKD